MGNGQIVGVFVCELRCSAATDAGCDCKRPYRCPGHQFPARHLTHVGPRYWIVLFINFLTIGGEMQAGQKLKISRSALDYLSFPKIISERSGDAAPTERA
jgi:hypothetical protein